MRFIFILQPITIFSVIAQTLFSFLQAEFDLTLQSMRVDLDTPIMLKTVDKAKNSLLGRRKKSKEASK